MYVHACIHTYQTRPSHETTSMTPHQEQVVIGPLTEGERVVVVVIATRVVTNGQNFSVVANGTCRVTNRASRPSLTLTQGCAGPLWTRPAASTARAPPTAPAATTSVCVSRVGLASIAKSLRPAPRHAAARGRAAPACAPATPATTAAAASSPSARKTKSSAPHPAWCSTAPLVVPFPS